MEIKEILTRIGYVRNKANLSAREVSLRMNMSPQYVAQLESGRIVLTVEKLLQILEICQFPIERFFSSNIDDYNIDIELNGKHIVSADLAEWTSGKINPDGTPIPEWLPTPYANLPTKGFIGLQGKHGASNIWFRNIKIKQL